MASKQTLRKTTTTAPRVRPAPTGRRERILAVATRRFAESGFEATTVRQIADDVNILSGSLYHHFATKEEMLQDILREPVQRVRDYATRIAALPLDAERRLVTLICTDLDELTHHHEVHAILYGERKMFRRNPDFAFVLGAKKEIYRAWQKIIEDGVREGQFSADTDLYLTISTIMRMLNTGAGWYINEDAVILDAYTPAALSSFYLRFVLRSIRTPARAGLPIPQPAEA